LEKRELGQGRIALDVEEWPLNTDPEAGLARLDADLL